MKSLHFLLISLLFITACATKSGVRGLQENTENFQQSIRWSSMQGATALMDPFFRENLVQYYADWMAKNKMVEYSIVATQLNEERNKANVWVEFTFYDIVYETLHKKREKQLWAYNSKANEWMIQTVE